MVLFIGNSKLAKRKQGTSDRQNSRLEKLEQLTRETRTAD